MVRLHMRGISKRFGSVRANAGIDLAVDRGEIHGLMGENGAGKSTLMGILYGLLQPDTGTISIDGRPRRFRGPSDAVSAGVGMVHQNFKLFDGLSAWENLIYRREPVSGPFVLADVARKDLRTISAEYDMPVEPDAIVGDMPIGVRQRLEILKALYRDAQILILDEPTAVLTPLECDKLFVALRKLADRGISVILVTHKLPELMAVTDRVTVLRDGEVAARFTTRESSEARIVRAMTGRDVAPLTNVRRVLPSQEAVLSVRDVSVVDAERTRVAQASFDVRRGEVVGIAGVAGNGQSELVGAIVGLTPCTGAIRIAGREARGLTVAERRQAGLSYVPEDRHATGSAPSVSLVDNFAFGRHRTPSFSRFGVLRTAHMQRHAAKLIERFGVKAGSPSMAIGRLSGGNMQKAIVARELSYGAPLVIAEQPTRGVDIGAVEFIHRALLAERDRDRAVLIVSSELSELLALSDRVLVMLDGRIVTELSGSSMNEIEIGRWMAGGSIAA